MRDWFNVEHLDAGRLLTEWRWLCPTQMTLVARNAFADLFLRQQDGSIFQLDVAIGKISKVADCEAQFVELAETPEKREDWFAESDELASAKRGLRPTRVNASDSVCPLHSPRVVLPTRRISSTSMTTLVFWETCTEQISSLPDGSKVRLVLKR